MPLLVRCPNPACGANCSVAEAFGGRPFRCPKCDKTFVVRPTLDAQKGDTKKNPPSSNADPFPVLPAEFGRYRVLRLLGRGGMGAVYLAQDSRLGRQVALKVPFFDAARSPQRAERFVREARSAAALDHPNICTVFDAGQVGGRPYITMAYVDGAPLEKEIDPEAPMPQARAAEIARKVALAIEHAHRKGTIHRDLKPANVMMTAAGEPVVMDFGLAKRVADADPNEAKLTRDGGVLGTPCYMAPEQLRGESSAVGPATDVYALGAMLFEMLTGRTPFVGGTTVVIGQILGSPVPPLREFRPDADARLDAVCQKALAKSPADRFGSMAEFADALGHYLRSPTTPRPRAAATIIAAAPVVDHSPFDRLCAAPSPEPVPNRAKRGRTGAAARRGTNWPIAAGVGACMLLAVLAALWAGGAFRLKAQDRAIPSENPPPDRLKTQDGAIVLENLPPDADVLVDNHAISVKPMDGKSSEIRVDPGTKHRLEVKKDGFKVFGEEVGVEAGGRQLVPVRLEREVRPFFGIFKNRLGDWKSDGGELLQDSLLTDCQLVFGDFTWGDYDFACEVKSIGVNAGVGLLYRVTGAGCGRFVVGSYALGRQNVMALADSVEQGSYAELGRRDAKLEKDRWYKLAVHLRGTHRQYFLDDKLAFECEDAKNPHGAVGLMTWGPARFRNIRLTDITGKVLFEHLPKLPATEGQWLPATEAASADELGCLKGHNAPVTSVAFTPAGQLVSGSNGNVGALDAGRGFVAVGPSGTICLWDAKIGNELNRSSLVDPQWTWGFVKLALSPDGSHFLSSAGVNDVRVIRLWGISGGKLQPLFDLNSSTGERGRGIRCVLDLGSGLAFSPDGRIALAVNHTGSVYAWDVGNGALVREIPGALQDVSCVAIAPDGKTAILARRNQPFAEIELGAGKETGRWQGAAGVVRSMAFAPDGAQMLTGGEDGAVRLWDVTRGNQICLVGKHERPVLAVAFSPDGKLALTGGEDQTVRLWGLDAGKKELACFTGHTGAVQAVAFSPDGRQAASGSADYTVRMWRLPPLSDAQKP